MIGIMSKDVGVLAADSGPETDAATGGAWHELDGELDAWARHGRTASFWWRDDDATAPTPELERLLALHARTEVPLSLAVIPQRMDGELTGALRPFEAGVTALQHGYAHDNHAPAGEKKAELVGSRPTPHILAELAQGWQNLLALPRRLPVMVPPWNRVAPHLIPLLPEIGLTGLSTFGPRRRASPTPASRQANTHVDPIDWRAGQAFRGLTESVRAAVSHLRDRRNATVDSTEPTGLLTHHLAMDEPTWRFVDAFLSRTSAHPAGQWLAADEIFGTA